MVGTRGGEGEGQKGGGGGETPRNSLPFSSDLVFCIDFPSPGFFSSPRLRKMDFLC